MTSINKNKYLKVRKGKENNNDNETSEEKINKLEQQVTNLMEQNENLQSWMNKYINTIKSMEKQIKQVQADLAREKEKKAESDSSSSNSSPLVKH